MKGIDEEPKQFRDPEAAPERPIVQPMQSQAPSTSFDEILRELQPKAARAQAKAEAVVESVKTEVETKVSKYKNYDEAYASEKYTDERIAAAKETARRAQEARRKQAFTPYVPSQQEESKGVALDLLRNPATAREAFILSEIFQRKY